MNNKLDLELTPYFDDFIAYYRKAEILQDKCVLGNAAYTSVGVDDDLMTQVYIYDVVNRQFADINRLLCPRARATHKDSQQHSHQYNRRGLKLEPCTAEWQPADQQVPPRRKPV